VEVGVKIEIGIGVGETCPTVADRQAPFRHLKTQVAVVETTFPPEQ
jgi:hypothetical protein